MEKGCPKCGRMIDYNNQKCPYCNYDFSQIDKYFENVEKEKYFEDEKYAGFIKRTIAGIIDIYIILLLEIPLFIVMNNQIDKDNIKLFIIIFTVIYIMYNSLLERTKMKGSLGKELLKIEVTDEYENPVTLAKAFARNIAKIVNVITLGIGFLACVTPPNKQTIGDKISKTNVLNKIKIKEERQLLIASLPKRLLAFMIDIAYILIIILIIDYAEKTIKGIDFSKIFTALKLITLILYFPYSESKTGKTRGKKLLNIKVTDIEGEKISFIKALIRYLLTVVDIITLGFLLPLVDKNRQTIKDLITNTVVIDE